MTCADGKERELGEDRYLNRLQEFLARRLPGLDVEAPVTGRTGLSRQVPQPPERDGIKGRARISHAGRGEAGPRWTVLLPLQRMSASFAEAVNNGVLYIAGLRKHPRGKIADDS